MPFSNPRWRLCVQRNIQSAVLLVLACGAFTHAAETPRSSHPGRMLGMQPACNNARILRYSPGETTSGANPLTLTIDGENFANGLRLAWKAGSINAEAVMLPTTVVNSSRLTADVPSNLLTSPGKAYFALVTAESSSCAALQRFRIRPAVVDVPRPRVTGAFVYTIGTVAGGGIEGFSGDGGPATSAQLDVPSATAVDSLGNLYIADYGNSRVRKVSNGILTTIAGTGFPGYSGDGGPATNAELSRPAYLAFDSSGNLYIADLGNATVRKISNGIITTVAGTGIQGFSGDGGPATSAQLDSPEGIALDSMGNLYIADTGNQRIRKISGGLISTIAGTGVAGYSGDSGPATSAMLQTPTGLALDSSGNVYIADFDNNRVRKISGGVITTVAGNGDTAFSGDGGPATSAGVDPFDVALDSIGNLYIVDDFFNQRVRKVSGGIINTIAGNGIQGYAGDGGPATGAELAGPEAVALDSNGDIFVTDTLNFRIRKLTPVGPVAPVLSITKIHTGNFTQGQMGATYQLTVSNSATAVASAGSVTVTDTLPPGLTLVSMAGAGWTCAPNANTCIRNDALAAGQSYPVLTTTVNVSASATSPVVNTAMVAGGGSASASATDSTIVTPSGPMVTLMPITLNPGDTAVLPVGVTVPASNALFVTLTSSDPSILSLSTASQAAMVNVLIPAGATASPGVRVVAGKSGAVIITATAAGYLPGSIMLTVATAGGPALGLVPTGGTPQSTVTNTPFAAPLAVTVIGSNPGGGTLVTFTAPATGASGSFAGGGATATATTNALGVAISPAFTANSIPGSYTVLASAPGVSNPAAFLLTNQGSAGIVLPALQLHAGNEVFLPISLSSPPANSVIVSVTSSDASVLSLSTATQASQANVLIQSGQTSANLRVVAGSPGTVTLTAAATGYPPAMVQLVVAP